jgi:hypothetical protein
MFTTWFAHPALLAALASVPVALAFFVYAERRRRGAVRKLADGPAFRNGLLVRARRRRWKSLCALLALPSPAPARNGG